MTDFFHRETETLNRRTLYTLGVVLTPLFMAAVAFCVTILLSLRYFGHEPVLAVLAFVVIALVFGGVFFAVIVLEIYLRSAIRQSKYTFLDIQQKYVILSEYIGEFKTLVKDDRVIMRRVSVIPLDKLIAADIIKRGIVLKTQGMDIKMYEGNSEWLSYHFMGNEIKWQKWWYNETGYKTSDKVLLPNLFGDLTAVRESLAQAKSRFNNTPEDKPYRFEEMPFVKLRKMRKLIDPNGTYDRKW